MKKRIITTVIFLAAMVLVSCIMVQVNHSGRVSSNGRRLGEALKQVNKTEITWDEVVPFEWDTMYCFTPYTSKEAMVQTVGFDSRFLQAGEYDDMVNLVFVKDQEVVSAVYGHGADLGYRLSAGEKIKKGDGTKFAVEKKGQEINFSEKAVADGLKR